MAAAELRIDRLKGQLGEPSPGFHDHLRFIEWLVLPNPLPTSDSGRLWKGPVQGETPALRGFLMEPGVGLEPTTPSLPWKCSTD